MKAIVVTCPHCGAKLPVAGTAVEVRCEYCGTAARIQRRTRVLERVVPPPVDGPRPIAVQRHNPFVLWMVVLGVVLSLVGGIVGWHVTRKTVWHQVEPSAPPRAASGAAAEWQGTSHPIVVDVDGNGTLDVVGRSRRVRAGDVVRPIALDGGSGRVLWEGEPLGTYSDTYQGLLAVAGDQLVFASPRGELRAFALATGAPRWTARLDERVRRFCEGDAATVIAVGADDVERRLRRADGTRVDAPAERTPEPPRGARPARPTCSALPDDRRPDLGRDHELARAVDLWSTRVVDAPGGRVVIGTRAKGTHVPTMVALDAAGAERWRVAIPRDPLAALERAPDHLVVGADVACTAYHVESVAKPETIACFALADGARRWDVVARGRGVRDLAIVGDLLLASSVGGLTAYRLVGGAIAWQLGG